MRNGSAASRCLKSDDIDPDMLDERARALLDYVDPNDLTLMYDSQPRQAAAPPVNQPLNSAVAGSEINFSDKELAAGAHPPAGIPPTSAIGRFRLRVEARPMHLPTMAFRGQ